jgi:hypothetical protein
MHGLVLLLLLLLLVLLLLLLQVLYELFDWPQQQGSRLGIIGISNTHDLDERVLPRIKRWGLKAAVHSAAAATYRYTPGVQGWQESITPGSVSHNDMTVACMSAPSGRCCGVE